MKLKNKQTGEIIDTLCEDITKGMVLFIDHHDGNPTTEYYNSLAELNEEWEDYKEPKELYIVDARHECYTGILNIEENPEWCARLVELGLGFETKEEAELAVEKLKALAQAKRDGKRMG